MADPAIDTRGLKPPQRLQQQERSSFESDNLSLHAEDPLSSPTEGLLEHHSKPNPKQLSPHNIALLKSSAINLVWILTWYLFATFLSVYNKWMFSEDHYNFQFPLFVSSVHMAVQFLLAGSSLLLFPRLRPKRTPTVSEYMYRVFPCALATSLDIGLSNLSLKTITLSFYTMCKSSTLAFVLVFAFLFRLEKPSLRLVCIILIIVAGVVLMVSDETEFEIVGFVAVMTAAACGGLRWALTEVLLRKESIGLTNPFASIFFLAPAQAAVLVTLSAAVEGYPTIFNSTFFSSFPKGLETSGFVLGGGALAFCMIMAEFFLIKRTSVVTLSVCGIFKEVATIFVSSIVFGDRLTVINIIGLCVTLFGIALYNWIKMRKAAQDARKTMREQHFGELRGLPRDSEDEGHKGRNPMYSIVAESTPILLSDAAMGYDSDSDDPTRNTRHGRRDEQYELQ